MVGNETEREALARFEAMLDAYGAAPRRWPADRRAWAEALLARSPEAEALHRAAARLDGLLDAAGVDAAPASLIGRVMASAPAAGSAHGAAPRGGWLGAWFKPALGLALAAILGLALGSVVSPFAPGTGDLAETEAVSLAFGLVPELEQ